MDTREVLILADPNGAAWSFAKGIYEKLNADPNRRVKYLLGHVNIRKFNDGEIFVKIDCNVRNKNCFFIHDSSMGAQDWAMSLVEVNDALVRSSAREVHNVLPYMKYSRQDRMTEPRTPISSGVIARMIGMECNGVITTDLHNPAITGSYDIPFDNLRAYLSIIGYLQNMYSDFLENVIIVAPDVGSAEMAKSYAKRLGCGVAIVDKSREKAGVVGSMKLIGDVAGKNVILVDDMIDTAGTLCKAGEVLKEKGALRIWACATHGLFSKDAVSKINASCFEKVIVTDSIPQIGSGAARGIPSELGTFKELPSLSGKIEVISLMTLFANAIGRISHGWSVSELFR